MGGGSNYFDTPAQRAERDARWKAHAERQLAERCDDRRKIADKIVMTLVDQINETVIRPGPTPEERECYDLAQELHDLKPQLVAVVLAQLDVNGGVK